MGENNQIPVKTVALREEDIQKIAQAVYDMLYNDLVTINHNSEYAMSNTSNLAGIIENQGAHIRSEIRSSSSGLQSNFYDIRSAISNLRR